MAQLSLRVLLLSSSIYALTSHAEPLTVALKQFADPVCNKQYLETDWAIPGGCIHYRIHLSNTSPERLNDITIRSRIPQYTRLESPPFLLENEQTMLKIPYAIHEAPEYPGDSIELIINTLLPTMQNPVIIGYTVKIDE